MPHRETFILDWMLLASNPTAATGEPQWGDRRPVSSHIVDTPAMRLYHIFLDLDVSNIQSKLHFLNKMVILDAKSL